MGNHTLCRILAFYMMCCSTWSAAAQTAYPDVLPPASKAGPLQRPSPEEQVKLLDQMRAYTIGYTKSLPNFICLEQTFRYIDTTGMNAWRLVDVVTARLSYFDQKEDYKLVSQNGRAVSGATYASLNGAFSTGDFGTHMREIFDPDNHAAFVWKRWTMLRGRLTHVFTYKVPLEYSNYTIEYRGEETPQNGGVQRVKVGYRGSVYVDNELHTIVRIAREPLNIPASFPIRQAQDTVDYDFIKIGHNQYFLPLVANLEMRSRNEITRNVKEFRLYQKFSSEAEIKFDGQQLPPLPEDKTKEQVPVTQPPK